MAPAVKKDFILKVKTLAGQERVLHINKQAKVGLVARQAARVLFPTFDAN